MLAARFGLVFHREKKELSAYTITIAKGGEKIRKDEDPPVPSFETRYSFTLKFTPDPGVLPPDADAPPDIFAAMQQQLGLHIQKTKAQVDVMVIDKVSKPSPN